MAAQASPELSGGSSDATAIKVYIYYPSGSTGQVGQPVRACVLNTLNFLPIFGLSSSTMVQTATMAVEQAQSGSSNPWTPDSTSNVPSQCPTS